MTTRTQTLPRDLRLDHKALYSLPDASELAVSCEEGAVWLTLDGDPRDFVLEPGERFETEDHGRVLIYALADSRISVAEVPRTRYSRNATMLTLSKFQPMPLRKAAR
jgi:hypothetical protein